MWEIIKFETLFGTIGGAAISLVCWSYNLDDVVPIRTMIIFVIISFAIIWGCVIRLYQLKNSVVEPFFKVIRHDEKYIIFQTNLHDYLGVGCFVSLYKKENGFLRSVGVVHIENIQDKLVQGVIFYSESEKNKVCDEILVIKPVLRAEDVHFLNTFLPYGKDLIL